MEFNMSDVFIQSLQITGLGMGLVFGAILLLWLMMSLLTRFTGDKDTSTAPSAGSASDSAPETAPLTPEHSPSKRGEKAQAAAIAVAMALADQEASCAHALPEPPTAIVSAWQLGMRTRLLAEKGNTRRRGR
jgi:Na+-transporting methylmalonyl-CoA/oxaloacetate decarboxylase gamma subunit